MTFERHGFSYRKIERQVSKVIEQPKPTLEQSGTMRRYKANIRAWNKDRSFVAKHELATLFKD